MVVGDLDIFGPVHCPAKADAKLPIYPYRMLTGAFGGQSMQSIPRWDFKVSEYRCRADHF
ncbi:MAG: hypothetical protein NVSMB26_11250 [Beijerinckiaceae bacterium]